jgi:hypothetical protein
MLVRILIDLEHRTCEGPKLAGLKWGGKENVRLSSGLHRIGGTLAAQS